ncbi:tyrosine-protein phosphatase [Pseudonocardia sp.]|uniref:tyrosine-protein phosphatase n=1 Tax=Pseudonocardia sp. TaxID=60912 RepID=UPI00260B0DE5|nr:tyrosine-protein phosphatase [Pseudonocardia sp.]MCW2721784.1 Protein tyrosine phosphatase [Pseudonocardia sp.]
MTATERWLRLEGVDNVRDVGGLPLRGGGTTRAGVLLRSASLQYLTPADVMRLVDEVGLRLVLDLRTPEEIERYGSTALTDAGVETVPLTLIGESRNYLPETGDDTDPLLRNYLGYLADHPANVVAAVRRLAAADAGPALVHCAAGKDRTGTVVALVLDAVGVERDAVVADYALSSEQIETMFRRWTTASGDPMPEDLTPHHPRAEVMETVLARLDEQHGGAAGWLAANGLTDEELERLRERFTA